jgi:hypothetical protein
MDTSYIAHRSPDGDRLLAILSLSILKTLDGAKIATLNQIGIRTISDLLHYPPIHRARLIVAVGRGLVARDMDLRALLRDGAIRADPATLVSASIELVDGIGAPTAGLFTSVLGVTTIGELAVFPPYVEAETLLRHEVGRFTEPASAPDELLPRTVGSVASTVRYSSIFLDEVHRYAGLPISRSRSPRRWTSASRSRSSRRRSRHRRRRARRAGERAAVAREAAPAMSRRSTRRR